MNFLKKLFSGGDAPEVEAIDHNGFSIRAEPLRDGSRWRIGAVIEKEIDGTLMSHQMIRADTLDSLEAAKDATVHKAKMLIDQQGDAIFRS